MSKKKTPYGFCILVHPQTQYTSGALGFICRSVENGSLVTTCRSRRECKATQAVAWDAISVRLQNC